MMKIDELRCKFMEQGLHHSELKANPIRQFESWYQQVIASDMHEPGAMTLATVDEAGQPWQRIVLLKMFDDDGFVFFTNYESRKAQQIGINPDVGLSFPWQSLGRQVMITGTATKIPAAESLKYFATRPRGSQLGAWASKQSQMINARSILETMVESMKNKYANNEVPLPPFWGGYRVSPKTLEFWQARESRLHDRFIYRKNAAGEWHSERMAP
jgi:pyridoxamine 5'-phosphate oxidase